MKTYKTQIYPEICCELCMEITHNHFECPICKDDYAGTSCYGDFPDLWDKRYCEKPIFHCEECNTRFEVVEYEDFPNIEIIEFIPSEESKIL